jgi:polar amino acid transport system substrate-binding protein
MAHLLYRARAAGRAAIVFFMAQVVAATGACAASPPAFTLYVAAEDSPPTGMREHAQITGRDVDKMAEIMNRTGTPWHIDLLPWKRAYAMAQGRADMCLLTTTRTPEREPLFKWVGPTDEVEWQFYGRPNPPFPIDSLDDARKLRIGTYSGDARDEFLRAQGFHVDSVQNDLLNPQKLLAGRIDLWAVAMLAGAPPMTQDVWGGGKLVPLLTFRRVQIYIACNRGVPDDLIARMNGAFDAMRRDGTLRRIERHYEHWGVAKP